MEGSGGHGRKTLAEDLREEAEQLRRRFVHHTRPKGQLTLEQARKLAEEIAECPDDPTNTHGP